MMNRVVITGMGIISPIGNTKQDVYQSLLTNRSGIESVDSWAQIKDLRVRVAGRCRDYDAKRIKGDACSCSPRRRDPSGM